MTTLSVRDHHRIAVVKNLRKASRDCACRCWTDGRGGERRSFCLPWRASPGVLLRPTAARRRAIPAAPRLPPIAADGWSARQLERHLPDAGSQARDSSSRFIPTNAAASGERSWSVNPSNFRVRSCFCAEIGHCPRRKAAFGEIAGLPSLPSRHYLRHAPVKSSLKCVQGLVADVFCLAELACPTSVGKLSCRMCRFGSVRIDSDFLDLGIQAGNCRNEHTPMFQTRR